MTSTGEGGNKKRAAGVRVPASTSNLGAGFDCLGLALDLWLEARIETGSRRPKYRGTVAGLDAETDLIYRILGERDALTDHHLTVRSDIPIAKGLGSSAAAIVAGLALARVLQGDPLDLEVIYRGAAAKEGHPDNAGPAVYGGLVLAAAHPTKLDLHPDIGIALAVPAKSISTKVARDLIPTVFPREVAIQQAARSAALVTGLMQGDADLIAYGMDDRLAVPHRKQLIAGYDEAVRAGVAAGAYGVTISGAGSAIVAITPLAERAAVADAVAAALTAAGTTTEVLTPDVAGAGLSVTSER